MKQLWDTSAVHFHSRQQSLTVSVKKIKKKRQNFYLISDMSPWDFFVQPVTNKFHVKRYQANFS